MSRRVRVASLVTIVDPPANMGESHNERVLLDLLLELGFTPEGAWWLCTQITFGREHIAHWRTGENGRLARVELDADRLWRENPHKDIRDLMLSLGYTPPEPVQNDVST